MRRALVVLFDHRADLLAALVYLCLAYLSFNALADYANGHHLFPEPWGGYAFAVAIDGSVLYAFISFRRAQVMAGVLLVSGAASTYFLQRWHAQHADHPLVVAGVVPGLMILVTFAWHRIREATPEEVPATRLGPPVGSSGLELTEPVAERPAEPAAQPAALRIAEPAASNGSAKVRLLRPSERRRVDRLAAEGLSANAISQRTKIPYRPVRQHLRLLETVGAEQSPNGDGGS